MSEKELALIIGEKILSAINEMQIAKKDFGQELVIPFKLPNINGNPDFMYSIKIQMPRFSYSTLDEDYNFKTESVTMAEYYGWQK